MEKKLQYTCSLCGRTFIVEGRSCASACPMSRHCNLVCCPHCGFSFPKGSRLVEFIKKIFKKRGDHELQT